MFLNSVLNFFIMHVHAWLPASNCFYCTAFLLINQLMSSGRPIKSQVSCYHRARKFLRTYSQVLSGKPIKFKVSCYHRARKFARTYAQAYFTFLFFKSQFSQLLTTGQRGPAFFWWKSQLIFSVHFWPLGWADMLQMCLCFLGFRSGLRLVPVCISHLYCLSKRG